MSNSCIIKFDNGRKTYLLFFFFLGNTNFQKLITFHYSKTTAVFKRRSSGSADFLSLHSKLNQQIIKINPLLNLPLWRTLMYSFTVSCNIFFSRMDSIVNHEFVIPIDSQEAHRPHCSSGQL